jgi:hypothetical protein
VAFLFGKVMSVKAQMGFGERPLYPVIATEGVERYLTGADHKAGASGERQSLGAKLASRPTAGLGRPVNVEVMLCFVEMAGGFRRRHGDGRHGCDDLEGGPHRAV